MTNKPQFSAHLEGFINLVTEAQKDYAWNYAEMSRLDQLTQDYLHALELEELDYSGRAKVATQLSRCRKLRRASKDTVEVLEPLVEFFDSDKGKQMLNLLRETLGKTRKVEKYMANRSYRNRVL